MTPTQVLTVAAIGSAAGLLGLLVLAALGYAAAVTLRKAFDHLFEKRQQRRERRAELDICRAIHALPATRPEDTP